MLLAGLAVGALTVGGLATAAPAVLPTGWGVALGAGPTPSAPAPMPPTAAGLALPLPVPDLPSAPLLRPTPPPPTVEPIPTPTDEPEPDDGPESETEPETADDGPADEGAPTEVVALTNQERAGAGCGPLGVDSRLAAAARRHSADMALLGYFSHTSQDGTSFVERILDQGHPSPAGENIAQGQRDAAEVVEAWMDSPGHRRNILDCEFTTIGVGFDERGNFWTQNFGF